MDPEVKHHIKSRDHCLFISSCRCFCSHRMKSILISFMVMAFCIHKSMYSHCSCALLADFHQWEYLCSSTVYFKWGDAGNSEHGCWRVKSCVQKSGWEDPCLRFLSLFGLGYVQWSDWTPEGLPERGTANWRAQKGYKEGVCSAVPGFWWKSVLVLGRECATLQ